MIIGNLENIDFYRDLFPTCAKAFDFLKSVNSNMQNARYEISAGIYAQVFMSQIRQEKDRHLETHHDFVDIQFVIDGYDIIGIKDAKSCNEIFINYDPSKDIAFFNEKPDYEIKLLSNHFIVIFPDEAHCPESADIIAKKVVVKVKKELFENMRS